jgi:hypothetical protein
VITAGILVSGPANGPSWKAEHRIIILQSTGFTLRILSQEQHADNNLVSDYEVDDGKETAKHFYERKGAEHSVDDEVEDPILPFKIANVGCQNHGLSKP